MTDPMTRPGLPPANPDLIASGDGPLRETDPAEYARLAAIRDAAMTRPGDVEAPTSSLMWRQCVCGAWYWGAPQSNGDVEVHDFKADAVAFERQLADIKTAIEIMDQKVTSYGEREDGTVQNYIVGDSTWHRVLAVARRSTPAAAGRRRGGPRVRGGARQGRVTDPMTRPGDVEPTVSDRDVLRAPALVDRDNADGLGEYADFRKVATTRISTFLMPPGTVYQTPEGLKAEDEDTRIAFDVQGGVYPIRESVFQASYVRGGPCDDQSCARCWDQDSRKYTR